MSIIFFLKKTYSTVKNNKSFDKRKKKIDDKSFLNGKQLIENKSINNIKKEELQLSFKSIDKKNQYQTTFKKKEKNSFKNKPFDENHHNKNVKSKKFLQ